MVYEMVENVQAEKYEFQVEEMEKEHHILSPSPFIMNGLTRKERQLKQLLFMALDQLHTTKNTAEIRYWFTEWDPSAYGMVQHMEFEDIWAKLYDEAKTGWSEKHEQLCERLVKGQPFLKSYGKWKTSKGKLKTANRRFFICCSLAQRQECSVASRLPARQKRLYVRSSIPSHSKRAASALYEIQLQRQALRV